jgi:hypothetical protein
MVDGMDDVPQQAAQRSTDFLRAEGHHVRFIPVSSPAQNSIGTDTYMKPAKHDHIV